MKTLNIFKIFINDLLENNSRNYKIDVLKKWKHNEDVKYYLNYLFNPYIITGISNKKLTKISNYKVSDLSFISVKDLLEYIRINNTGKDNILQAIYNFKYSSTNNNLYSVEELNLLNAIITKNLQLGIDSTTINKVIPKLIPEFNIQLANKYFDKPEYVEGKEFALTTKIDGGRIIAMKQDGEVSFFTRAGQKYEGLVDLETELASCEENNFILDGEITLLDKGNLTSKDQYKQTMMITRKDGEKHGIKMLVFDCLPLEHFVKNESNLSYRVRRGMLDYLFAENNFKYFNLLPILYQGTDTSEIMKWLNYNIENGEEGVMINIINAPYEFKRTSSLLKVKKMQDVDLRIKGFEEGSNSNKGKLGAFIVDYKGNDVKVGSGYSKELREEIWKNPEDYIGQIISVQYFEETKNQNGGISLRFPVFLDFRPDKVEADA